MSRKDFPKRRKLPLAVRLSFILIFAGVLPLLITVSVSEYDARSQLITQAQNTMQTDARMNAQAIDAYLQERLLDAATLSQVPAVQDFLLIQPPPPLTPAYTVNVYASLGAGLYRDKHYISWWLFYPNGKPGVSYPINIQPHHYGQYVVPPEQLQIIKNDQAGQPVLSPVYYDTALHREFIDIYSPVYKDGKPTETFLGFVRASLSLDYIWHIVQSDQGFNKSGGAFILDQNHIRIADTKETDPQKLFLASTALPALVQHQITTENWYGQGRNATLPIDGALSTPRGDEVASQMLTISNWTYMVTSPSTAVTQIADDQLSLTIVVALLVVMLAAAIGFWVSSRITRSVMRSVDQLRENSEALNILAKKQQGASTEQLWILDAIKMTQQSLQYYTDATRIAVRKLGMVGMELESNWHQQNMEIIKQGLQHILTTANYLEKATHYQGDSSQKLATAVKVTVQVNDQLADGASSATEAASQLEVVVNNLRSIIGQ